VSTVAPAGSWSGSIRRPRSVAASNSRSSRRERPGWPPKQAAPIVPVIVSGTQRIWTKGHPRNLGLNKVPVTVAVGAPFPAAQDVAQTDAALRDHHPAGAYWVPRRLGGGAPGRTPRAGPRGSTNRGQANRREENRDRCEPSHAGVVRFVCVRYVFLVAGGIAHMLEMHQKADRNAPHGSRPHR
jgi:hypothetical protein